MSTPKNPFQILRNKKGIAILMAIFTVMLVSFIAIEVSEDATVEYLIASNEVNRLKAYYAAKAGVEMSLLRIYIYQQAQAQFGANVPASMLDKIWQFPFAWPPVLPGDASSFDKEEFQKATTDSLMEGQYLATISSEGSKIDLNDLNSPSKALQESTKAQLIQLLQGRLDDDADWARDNPDLRPEEVVNRIVDYVTPGDTSASGGAKRSAGYRDMPDNFPPGRPLMTLQELHMIDGVTDEIYKILAPKVTVHGIKSIQINYANIDILRSLDPSITKEIAEEIIKRRDDENLGGPFKDDKDFYGFLGTQIGDTKKIEDKKIPLEFKEENTFLIKSTGISNKSTREIIAVVYDFDKVKTRLANLVSKEKATPSPSPSSGQPGAPTPTPGISPSPSPSASPSATPKLGKPRVVHWSES